MSILPLLLTLVVSADPEFRIVDLRTGDDVSASAMADAVATADVLFLGEEHDNAVGHAAHHEIVRRLHAKRPNLAISLEMFERDVQGVVDDYVRGRIEESNFLDQSRPWGDYATHYRPFVEMAKKEGLDVIASNVPRPIAAKVAKGEKTSISDAAFMPRSTTAPEDPYREAFAEMMGSHAGTDDAESMHRYYAAQCLKDDAMAEAITDHLAIRSGQRPLVVHVAGTFHVDYGLGTAQRVQTRCPLLRTVVVSMESTADVSAFEPDVAKPKGHYLIVVPEPEPAEDDSSTGEAEPAESKDG